MKLLSSHYDAIFFSPHLDDAVLSHGGTIAKLIAEGKKVLVVTIFTQGKSDPISRDGKRFLGECGKSNVREMFNDRKKEDKNAGRMLGFNTLHLGYDAEIYRLRPKTFINSYFPYFRFVYPSFKEVFRGKISLADNKLQGRIKKDLKSIIKKYGRPSTKIYGPLGVGDHVDHLIVFEALNSLKIKNLLFWEDVPYNNPEKIRKRLGGLVKEGLTFSLQKLNIGKHVALKKKAILQYASQIQMLFPDGLTAMAYETYYKKINKNNLTLADSEVVQQEKDKKRRVYETIDPSKYDDRFQDIPFYELEEFRVYKKLVEDLPSEFSILDIGCGTGRLIKAFPDQNYLGIDISGNLISFAQKKYEKDGRAFLVLDYQKELKKLPQREFDLILLIGTLESSPDPIGEILTLLDRVADGGRIIFTCWNKRNLLARFFNFRMKIKSKAQDYERTYFGFRDLRRRLVPLARKERLHFKINSKWVVPSGLFRWLKQLSPRFASKLFPLGFSFLEIINSKFNLGFGSDWVVTVYKTERKSSESKVKK